MADISSPQPAHTTSTSQTINRTEFIGLMAMMFATIAFSVDAMLPALADIAADLSPEAVNRAQLVVGFFAIGLGAGTLVTGPFSDSWGRKPVVLSGLALYAVGAVCAAVAPNLEMLLLARFVQGLGAAAPRVVGLSIIRDMYKGREMAKITSFVMMIFTLFPAVAPTIGAFLTGLGGWRTIFYAFIIFAIVISTWFSTRLVETLPKERRTKFRASALIAAGKEVLTHRMVVICILVMTLTFSMLMSFINSAQQVYSIVFLRGDSFHYWFALVALISASSSAMNAYLVSRIGMRAIITWTLGIQLVLSGLFMIALLSPIGSMENDTLRFVLFLIWQTSLFYMLGLLMGNLNALALEPMGHIAGMAASITGGVSTILALLIAIPIGLLFNGTIWPLLIGIFILSSAAFAMSNRIPDRDKSTD